MRLHSIFFLVITLIMTLVVFNACDSKKKVKLGPSCSSDDDCAGGWICEKEHCARGKRTAEELAQRQAKIEAEKMRKRKAKIAARTQTKKGQGRVSVKLCPFFKNTFASVGSIVAVNQKTKFREMISMQMETEKNMTQSEFTFYSLPLGTYEIYATYGVQVEGKFDTHRLKCDPKATKRACKDGELRIVEVVLPKDMKKEALECDWIAE